MNGAVSLLVAICASVVAAIALAFSFSGLNPTIAVTSLAIGAATGAWQYYKWRDRAPRPKAPLGVWDWFVIVCFALFSLRAFCWLVFTDDDKLEIISPNNLGDIALHITYIRNLANGAPFWPDNPIFAGGKIHYPLGIDVFNSLLTLAGLDVFRGLIWVGLASCVLTGIAFYKWGRGFALAGFLFNGGLAGFQFFNGFHFEDYQTVLAWKSIPLAMLVTQRGLLYAIPAGMFLLWSWRERFFSGKEIQDRRPLPFWVELLLYSTMPVFHLHAFIFLSLLLGCWLLWLVASRLDRAEAHGIPYLVKLIACAFVPATVLTGFITGFFKSSSMVHWPSDWLWMYDEQPMFDAWAEDLNLPSFWMELAGRLACWLVNFGVLPFFIIALMWVLIRNRKSPSARHAAAFVFPCVLISIFSLVVMLAPWEWDNTKIMIWPYFVMLPFLWEQLLSKWKWPLQAICCFVLYFSGFISLFGGIDGTHTGYDIATRSELDGVESAVRNLPKGAIFACAPTYNHPLLLVGRNVVAGYPGHLWSHGVDSKQQLARLDFLLNGDPSWKAIARELHVRYIFWGTPEQKDYRTSEQPWKQNCPLVAEGPWGEIYEVRN